MHIRIKSRDELGIKDSSAPQFQRIYASATPALGRGGQEVAFKWERRHTQFLRALNARGRPELVDQVIQWALGKGSLLLEDEKDTRPKQVKIDEGFEAWFPLIEFGNTYAERIGELGNFWELAGIPYDGPLNTMVYNPIDTPHLVVPVWTTLNRFPKVGLVWWPRFHPAGFKARGRNPMNHIYIEKKSAAPYLGEWPPALPEQSEPAPAAGYEIVIPRGVPVYQMAGGKSKVFNASRDLSARVIAEAAGWGKIDDQRWVELSDTRRVA